MAVPEGRDGAFLPLAGEKPVHCRGDGIRVGAQELIGTHGDCLRPLGAVAKGHAWHSHDRCLFGYAAGVGYHRQAAFNQVVEFEVSERLCQMKSAGSERGSVNELMTLRVRGWTGKIRGNPFELFMISSSSRLRLAGSSTLFGRWRVRTI